MWKDCFINSEKYELKLINSVFIYKTICGATKFMKCFQDVKGFWSNYLHETYPLLNAFSKWMDTKENKLFLHFLLTESTIYKLDKELSIHLVGM